MYIIVKNLSKGSKKNTKKTYFSWESCVIIMLMIFCDSSAKYNTK